MRLIVGLSSECCQGAVFSVSFSEDNPFLLAIGGSKGTLEVSHLSVSCLWVDFWIFERLFYGG